MSVTRLQGKDGVIIDSSKFLELPKGTTANRPAAPRIGMLRYNTETDFLECVLETHSTNQVFQEWRKLAHLDAANKILTSQLPDSITSNMNYKGTWDAAINDINISSSETSTAEPLPDPTTPGDYYIVRVEGSGNSAPTLVAGEAPYNVGSWIVANGTSWEKVDTSQIRMVANAVEFNSMMLTSRNKHNLLNVNRVQQAIENLSEYALDRKLGDTVIGNITFSNADNAKLFISTGTALLPSLAFNQDSDTGIYQATANTISFSTSGVNRLTITDSNIQHNVTQTNIDGSVAAPAITFSAANTGFYQSAGAIAVSVGGANQLTIDGTKTSAKIIALQDGTVSAPSLTFTSDSTTGLFKSSNQLSSAVAGVEILRCTDTSVKPQKPILLLDGTASSPTISFSTETNTGFYHSTGAILTTVQGTDVLKAETTGLTSSVALNMKLNAINFSDSGKTASIKSDSTRLKFESSSTADMFNFGTASTNYFTIYNDALMIPAKQATDSFVAASGLMRFNATKFEGYIGSAWVDLSSGGRITTRGTVSAPAIYFNDDVGKNTGIYSPAEDTLGLVTNGVERLRISSTKTIAYAPIELNYASKVLTISNETSEIQFQASTAMKFTNKVLSTNDIGLYDNAIDSRKTYFRYTDGLIIEGNKPLAEKYFNNYTFLPDITAIDAYILDHKYNGTYQTNTGGGVNDSVVVNLSSTNNRLQMQALMSIDNKPTLKFRTGSGSTISPWVTALYDGCTASTISLSNWIETTSTTGWKNTTFGGGFYMDEDTSVKVFGAKKIYTANATADSISTAGGITCAGALTQGSDLKLKDNIKRLQNTRANLHKLNGYSFDRNDLFDFLGKPLKDMGVIAQEIQEVYPELVKVGSNGILSVAYGNISAVLIEATKEIDLEVVDLRKQVSELQEQMRTLLQLFQNKSN